MLVVNKLQKRVAKGKGRGTKPAEVVESIGRLKERYSRVARYYLGVRQPDEGVPLQLG